jgi:aconitate hydratase
VFKGDENWQASKSRPGQTYAWDDNSTYVQNPPYFEGMGKMTPAGDIKGARVLACSATRSPPTTSRPAGSIKAQPCRRLPDGTRCVGVPTSTQYGTRRGNHEVMMRGTFANIRIKNHMLGPNGVEGGYTFHYPDGEDVDLRRRHEVQAEGVPLVIFAGVEYGNGSSRDWAAKGTNLLGVRAVIAQSFERIHRSNLVGMGVGLPGQSTTGTIWEARTRWRWASPRTVSAPMSTGSSCAALTRRRRSIMASNSAPATSLARWKAPSARPARKTRRKA